MLYVGRTAFTARLSVFDVPITVSLRAKRLRLVGLMSVSLPTGIITFIHATFIHFAFLFDRKKQHEHTVSLLSLFLENKHY